MPWTNYHSHSHYCDGKKAPELHIQSAIAKGFLAFGCSSHAYVPFEQSWSMKEEKEEAYCKEIKELKEKYQEQIEIYLSLEVDFIPGMIGPSLMKEKLGLDYTVGSVHFVDAVENGRPWGIDGTLMRFEEGLEEKYQGDIRAAVKRYYELSQQMLDEDCPEVLGHMDKIKMHNKGERYFKETENWYQKTVLDFLESVRASGTIVEVNTRGLYKKKTFSPYPSPWILEHIHQMQIPIMLNSDSHHPDDIDKFYLETAQLLHDIGFRKMRVLLAGEWQDRAFDPKGIIA
ncbi:MAG: histidinol-phosphatase [Bacteroidota bacterium]